MPPLQSERRVFLGNLEDIREKSGV